MNAPLRNSFEFGPWTLEKVSDAFDLSCVDCGDADLNEYFQKDSAAYRKELMTQTYVFHETGSDVLMATVDFCNDALPKEVMPNASRRQIPFVKRGFKTFPAVKITRLGVRKEFHGKHIGSALIATVKRFFLDDNRTGCRFVTVDAYRAAASFYERNGFVRTKGEEEADAPTIPLFFDLLRLEVESGTPASGRAA